MHRYAHHRRPQDTAVINISGLIDLKNRLIFMIGRFYAIHRLVQMWIKGQPNRIDALHSQFFEVFE